MDSVVFQQESDSSSENFQVVSIYSSKDFDLGILGLRGSAASSILTMSQEPDG
jgi:hypothetical protein